MFTAIEIIIAVALIILILLQERSAGLGGLLGGGEGGAGVYHARRGLEKMIYYSTIGLVGLFIVVAILHLLI